MNTTEKKTLSFIGKIHYTRMDLHEDGKFKK